MSISERRNQRDYALISQIKKQAFSISGAQIYGKKKRVVTLNGR
jgi:hypothetical protein